MLFDPFSHADMYEKPATVAFHITPDIVQIHQAASEWCRRLEHTNVRIGIFGALDSGRSSMINTIAGFCLAEVEGSEAAREHREYQCGDSGVVYVNLPGSGIGRRSAQNYVNKFRLLENYDAFIFVTRGRVTDNEVLLYAQLRAAHRPVFIARNFFNDALYEELGRPRDQRRNEYQLKAKIRQECREMLCDFNAMVFLISAVPHAARDELPVLIDQLIGALQDLNEHKYIRALGGITSQTYAFLERKRKLAHDVVYRYASAIGMAAVLRSSGGGVAIDVSVLVKMGRELAKIYQFSLRSDEISAPLRQLLSNFISRNGIEAALKQRAPLVGARERGKWVAVFGEGTAALDAASLATSHGHEAIAAFHQEAARTLEQSLQKRG